MTPILAMLTALFVQVPQQDRDPNAMLAAAVTFAVDSMPASIRDAMAREAPDGEIVLVKRVRLSEGADAALSDAVDPAAVAAMSPVHRLAPVDDVLVCDAGAPGERTPERLLFPCELKGAALVLEVALVRLEGDEAEAAVRYNYPHGGRAAYRGDHLLLERRNGAWQVVRILGTIVT